MTANILRIIGETTDQRPVYAGVFQFHETTGLPLDVVLECIRDAGGVPCWVSFVLDAVEAGMSEDRALSKLEPAIVDSYGSKFSATVMRRLRDHDVARMSDAVRLGTAMHERLEKFLKEEK